ncbi:MAG TPA: methyltransferase domain-containing protein [Vicinamibacterales bacterium]|jgi:ubiquinone/menaquinone biosynthesis C-methylase UbiE
MSTPPDLSQIVDGFNCRASSYARNDWHRRCAERLVRLCELQPGEHVLDAGTGTGFAAIAAARLVGPEGRVLGIDVSAGMLRAARVAIEAAGLMNIELREADATHLPDLPTATFDVVTCAAALLYMAVTPALREWHRLLKPGGRIAFSTMCAGSPPAATIYRECALAFGVSLRDPSAALGSPAASRDVLESVGFEVIDILTETIEFTDQDLSLAWESNFRSAAHAEAQRLSVETQEAFKRVYLDALAREHAERPGALNQANLLYVVGRRP